MLPNLIKINFSYPEIVNAKERVQEKLDHSGFEDYLAELSFKYQTGDLNKREKAELCVIKNATIIFGAKDIQFMMPSTGTVMQYIEKNHDRIMSPKFLLDGDFSKEIDGNKYAANYEINLEDIGKAKMVWIPNDRRLPVIKDNDPCIIESFEQSFNNEKLIHGYSDNYPAQTIGEKMKDMERS